MQKMFYTEVYDCPACGVDVRRSRVRGYFHPNPTRYTRCVKCQTPGVLKLSRPDQIDGMSRSPISLLLRLLGAPLYRCAGCRFQYYDWRQLTPTTPAE